MYPVRHFRARVDATALWLMGRYYEFVWEPEYVEMGNFREEWRPEVDTSSVWDHESKTELTWEQFQEQTLWYYDAARISALIYSQVTAYDPV